MRINHVEMTVEEIDCWHQAQQGKRTNLVKHGFDFIFNLANKVSVILGIARFTK